MAKVKKKKRRGAIMGRSDIPYAQRLAMKHQADIAVNRDHAAKIGFPIVNGQVMACTDEDGNAVNPKLMGVTV